MNKTTYRAYLDSEAWQKKRNKFLRRRNRRNHCKLCFAFGPVDVHHLTYARAGHEIMSDLKGLCRECHQFVHDCIQIGRESNPSHYFYNRLGRAWNREANKKHYWKLRTTDPARFKQLAQQFFLNHDLAHSAVQKRYASLPLYNRWPQESPTPTSTAGD